jgi:hypothetical protein
MDDRLDRALEDVEAGRGETFDNDEDFLASLDESPAASRMDKGLQTRKLGSLQIWMVRARLGTAAERALNRPLLALACDGRRI